MIERIGDRRLFDKAERLAWLQQRQRELEAALDLTKGDMQAVDEAEAYEASEAA
ncbi:hypothetical protein [Pelomicrobium methylotrophicum]|uniref:hypothetical protein n=1 Tax=Pelomicrobium methylotrophicum TaxID=2602750 RepID=UPI001969CB5D|nr:hypothetical protein [Pelomicrobium methylotrophicum]